VQLIVARRRQRGGHIGSHCWFLSKSRFLAHLDLRGPENSSPSD
jgi:hypothetical protein